MKLLLQLVEFAARGWILDLDQQQLVVWETHHKIWHATASGRYIEDLATGVPQRRDNLCLVRVNFSWTPAPSTHDFAPASIAIRAAAYGHGVGRHAASLTRARSLEPFRKTRI